MLVDLEALPESTLRMFDHGQLAPLQTSSVQGRPLDAQRVAS
jgi:hypothetical protein